jgi:hypothetical protein
MSIRRLSALGASRVQGGQHHVPGEGGLDGDVGGLAVADLADRDHVRVGAQHRAQPGVEGHPGLRGDLHLLDARDPRLDRVLDREDRAGSVVEHVQGGVQGGRLARPGVPGHEHGPMRAVDRVVEAVLLVAVHPERLEVLDDDALVEDAQHRALAVDEREGDDADVDAPALDVQCQAPVLGDAALGGVEVGHDLDPRDHRRCHPAAHLRVEHPVDAEQHPGVPLFGVDVDVEAPAGRPGR